MRVLLVKTSSMGDIIHSLPAVTDAFNQLADFQLDWVVEESFVDLVARHPAVNQAIPCALRRWRSHPLQGIIEWRKMQRLIRAQRYDAVIDAQGLLKSAIITRLAKGPKYGLDRQSAREGVASFFVNFPQQISWGKHAVERVRQLFSQSLNYPLPTTAADYGLAVRGKGDSIGRGSQLIFFHGTTWASKHYPEHYWRDLCKIASVAGCKVSLPWGNAEEKARAQRLAESMDGVEVLPAMSLSKLLDFMLTLDGFVAVDTGLAHLAAAAGLVGVALYGPTDPAKTGVVGANAKSLSANFPCAPCFHSECSYQGNEGQGVYPACFSQLPPEHVWQALVDLSHRIA